MAPASSPDLDLGFFENLKVNVTRDSTNPRQWFLDVSKHACAHQACKLFASISVSYCQLIVRKNIISSQTQNLYLCIQNLHTHAATCVRVYPRVHVYTMAGNENASARVFDDLKSIISATRNHSCSCVLADGNSREKVVPTLSLRLSYCGIWSGASAGAICAPIGTGVPI